MHEKVKEFIVNELMTNKSVRIENDTSLIISGLIDSFAILDIMQFIADELKVKIPEDKVKRGDFDTIDKIVETTRRFQ